ncbi:hypothetical protein FGO68_gene7298 [Halteria grandinella]|uniref:Uncharacterized protein n=1 Tax=Halteria grandinella TaxID=5974 RepID=A0A8J8T3P0_HALGN|nr:hypothetical protein FGO68_gene7298 [Halteria grandinella]
MQALVCIQGSANLKRLTIYSCQTVNSPITDLTLFIESFKNLKLLHLYQRSLIVNLYQLPKLETLNLIEPRVEWNEQLVLAHPSLKELVIVGEKMNIDQVRGIVRNKRAGFKIAANVDFSESQAIVLAKEYPNYIFSI